MCICTRLTCAAAVIPVKMINANAAVVMIAFLVFIFSSSVDDDAAAQHIHPAREVERAVVTRNKADGHGRVQRQLAVDAVSRDHDLLSAGIVGFANERDPGTSAASQPK